MSPDEKKLPRIRTFRTDATGFMAERKLSQLDIASRAYVNQQNAPAVVTKIFSKKMALMTLVALSLLASGFVLVWLFFTTSEETLPPTTTTSLIKKFISVDQEKTIQFTPANPGLLVTAIQQERERMLRIGSIVQLQITLTAKEFGTALGWTPPASFWESANPEFNALAVYSAPIGAFAVIIPTHDFKETLASLFAWERTAWSDWKPFIAVEHVKNINQFTFKDEIVRNNDARVLTDKNGISILGYVIFNKKFLVMATSREALALILEKLIALPPQ